MANLGLLLSNIKDPESRQNFPKLNDFLIVEDILDGGFRSFEINFSGAVTNYRLPHRLGFQPKDIIQTSLTGTGSITYNEDKFTTEFLDLTTTAAASVRFLAGSLGTLTVIEG